ncbi:MAG: hypothetical protein A2365_02435 [Candidatus Nealsonbacteria bacterium RIFOXYB1_FULL_40_15]|uniref:Uncharacterized protein n=2 Tax=Candidatus Nealsoniibacteriota TaxID=1817911 RepID=A0A1G2EPC6_9BACT|nr:MAG: hypothetical protein A2365_02435 [Candidatus Nealsonbacteria bacterium RIFOXYB1_FULL_40_15]OGZ27646.1 MAG: hypothetical protein A2427_02760 [Candidatus Nealsonbacteria bacterium RIFOXYC1_FULL_40_7]OGZ28690.1 MAG: hypothetical protein A2562_00565 [Candidatus Nealsonbacteria bacterium RIFOXYD1_FULL_39_11]
MKMYLVTHGDRAYGKDPHHTAEGLDQLMRIVLPDDIACVVVGTGFRFEEVYQFTGAKYLNVPIWSSPFCGSSDSLDRTGMIVVLGSTGRLVETHEYMGLDVPCFDAWAFIASHSDRTLFCAGAELMLALSKGCANPPKIEKASLYEIDLEAKTIRKIS